MGKICRKKFKDFLIVLLQTSVIVFVTVCAVVPVSCKVTTSGIEVIGGDYELPVLETVNVESEFKVTLNFGKEISLVNAIVTPFIENVSDSDLHSTDDFVSQSILAAGGKFGFVESKVELSDDKKIISFVFNEPTEIGKKYEIYGTVKDIIGNTLTFCVPFTGYNSHVPDVLITEVHTMLCSEDNTDKIKMSRRAEYVEFLCLEDGNLAGLKLCSGYKGENFSYEFPAIDVSKGEIFVLHMRMSGDGCVNEFGNELDLASGQFAKDSVRDLYHSSTTRCIGEKTDILVLKNIIDDKIVDAVMYRDSKVSEWSEKLKEDYSFNLDMLKIYSSTDIDNAIDVSTLTPSKSIQRANAAEIFDLIFEDEEIEYPLKVSISDWIINSCTPGKL